MLSLRNSTAWKRFRNNRILFPIYENTLGEVVRKIRIRNRSKEIQKNGSNIIYEIDNILSQTSCTFFVDCGTLLGFIREGKLIKWDYDIDYGIMIDSNFTWDNLESVMKKNDFLLDHQFRLNGEITEQTYRKEKTLVDFFNHFNEEEHTCFYAYYKKNNYKYNSDNEMSVYKFRGVKISGTKLLSVDGDHVHIPNEAELYLENLYGSNWRVPDPNYKSGSGPCTMKLDDTFIGVLESFN